MSTNATTSEACFQLRHRYFDVASNKWVTVDLLGPYTMDNALFEAQHILTLHAGDTDRAYVGVEDMRKPILSMNGRASNSDLCDMVGMFATEAYHKAVYEAIKKG